MIDIERRAQFLDATDLLQNATAEMMRHSDDRLMLLPVRVYAYALQARKWRAICVDDVAPLPKTGQDPFDDLVLPPEQKRLIQALVKNQIRQFHTPGNVDAKEKIAQSQYLSMDLIRGKGRGLIILLHGVPGVGKTSTAECVALSLRRPLFPVTCGDLGTSPEDVAKRLEEYFTLAQKWGCVLLLDEADVFLARRLTGDVKRNALVSVFLRVLEYYAGVLILTTNRVAEFDEAFRSRIHVSIYYEPLKKKSSDAIWDMNIRRLGEMGVEYDTTEIKAFVEQFWQKTKEEKRRRWNGRQIKNAFQTALALANWDYHENTNGDAKKPEKPKITAKHFEMVELTSKHFDNYLDEVFENPDGGVYADQARRHQYRKDDAKGLKLSDAQWVKDSATPPSNSRDPALSRKMSARRDAEGTEETAGAPRENSMPLNMAQMQQMLDFMRLQEQQAQQTPTRPAARSGRQRPSVDSDDE